MPAVLTHNAYGKSQIRLTKVTRHADRHDLKELCVAVQLEGDFAASYTSGDNSNIIATDSMKNVIYALAKNHPLTEIEDFGQTLARQFIEHYSHVSLATISLVEQPWRRIEVNGAKHRHAFLGGGGEKRTCTVTQNRQDVQVESGLNDLLLLKTTDSAFCGFLRDRYTTLAETEDRIFATSLTADWLYEGADVDWNSCHDRVRQTLLEVFAGHKSLAVQQTLYAMGDAALEACPKIQQIKLTMPNQHRLLVNLQPFGLDNDKEIFAATEEPYGIITATLRRQSDQSSES